MGIIFNASSTTGDLTNLVKDHHLDRCFLQQYRHQGGRGGGGEGGTGSDEMDGGEAAQIF